MTLMSLQSYLQYIDKYWDMQDGYKVANLFSIKYNQAANLAQNEYPDNIVAKMVKMPIDELACCHLKCLFYATNGRFLDAYQQQSQLTQALTKIMQSRKEENWFLPLMYVACLDLRLLAQRAEKDRISVTEKPGEILEKAAECLMGCFRVCAADNRASEEDTKRIGMLNLVNQLFKVYFRINKLHLCKPLIRAIDALPFKDNFSLSQQITYRYFVGRKAMFDSDYNLADKYLTYAFENCHRANRRNKRLILIYLVPVKMLLGYIPSRSVLEKYDVIQFWDLVQAVVQGNLRLFDALMIKHEEFFIKCGIYLIVDKLKILAYRNLFRKVYNILGTHQIPVEALQTALVFLGQDDVDLDETQCIVANLIFEGKIKGYISHQHRKVVVSKQIPFPPLTSLS